ncbi:hypothetical protein EMIHUDRAFT_433885, partial [Emiliania huxleyi CCMP1516]|uniref:Lipid-binding serum glycoprotein C-terminal domain-containing protein n=2 Tax=Emiliania huxleyi TaxID=2903 RepID=A0A0D3KIG9_EMIH1
MWPILVASTAVNPAATLSPAGLRVWLTEEGVAMLERSLAPVLGSIVCAAPVPRIARSFPGLEVTVDHMRLFDCETDALSLSPAVAVEGDVLAIQVDGLSAQFMADYCWGTGWGWATIWQCGPVEGTLKNGSSASLTLTARRGASGSLELGAREVSIVPDVGHVALQVAFGLGGAFDGLGGLNGIFGILLGPVVGDLLGTVLTNATAALADAPSRLTLPDVTAEGGLVRPTPLTPEALPAAAHSTYLDTSLLSLGWINASSGVGAAPSNLFSVDIRCSLNDSRAAGAAPADAPGGGGGGTEAALAGKAALRQTADAGSPQQPPPRHEGYMASVALSSLPFSTAIETARKLGHLTYRLSTATLLSPTLWRGGHYGLDAALSPSVSFGPAEWAGGGPARATASGGRFAVDLTAALTSAGGAGLSSTLVAHASTVGGVASRDVSGEWRARWAGVSRASAQLGACEPSEARVAALGDGAISGEASSPLLQLWWRPASEVELLACEAAVLCSLTGLPAAGPAPSALSSLAALDTLRSAAVAVSDEAAAPLTACAAAAVAKGGSQRPSAALRCAAAALRSPLDAAEPKADRSLSDLMLGDAHGLYASGRAAAAEATEHGAAALAAIAAADCLGGGTPGVSLREGAGAGADNLRAIASHLAPLGRCALGAARGPLDDLGAALDSLSGGTPAAALAREALLRPSDELACLVHQPPDAPASFAASLDCALAA